MSSDASASTDSNTYYEDDFSSTEEDSSQGSQRDPLAPVLLCLLPGCLCIYVFSEMTCLRGRDAGKVLAQYV